MTNTPERANHRGVAHFFVTRDNRRDGDYVIRICGVAHAEKEAERDDGEQADHFSFDISGELNFMRAGGRRLANWSCAFRVE
jgi:hypothetical protein